MKRWMTFYALLTTFCAMLLYFNTTLFAKCLSFFLTLSFFIFFILSILSYVRKKRKLCNLTVEFNYLDSTKRGTLDKSQSMTNPLAKEAAISSPYNNSER